MKEKQKSELRVSRQYIEVERERDSIRSGQSKKCAAAVCVFQLDSVRVIVDSVRVRVIEIER